LLLLLLRSTLRCLHRKAKQALVSSGCGAPCSSAALVARKTSPSYQLGRASPALVKARSTSVHHANPQVHFAPIALATDSALQLRLPAPEIILLHYLQIIELPRCGCHTCCSLAHSETPSSSKKELHKSHSRDDEQPAHAKPPSTIIHTQNTRSLQEPSESRPSPLASITSERLTRLRTQACTAFHTSTSNHTQSHHARRHNGTL
jgi:hypothetical protein